MTLKANLISRFKQIAYSFGSIITMLLTYRHMNDFFIKCFGEHAKIVTPLTTVAIGIIYTLILALVVDPILSIFGDGTIVKDEIKWKNEKIEVESLDYLVEKSWESSIHSVCATVKCIPNRVWLFSFLRFLGFGILIYGSGNNLAFTKTNGGCSKRYKVLNNNEVFINSFYSASKEDNGNIWDIVFDIKLLDPSAQKSSIYTCFAFGTKKHKIKCKRLVKKLIYKPLNVTMIKE